MISVRVSRIVSDKNGNVKHVEISGMDDYIQSMNDSQIDSDVSFFKAFSRSIGTTTFHVKRYLLLSRYYLLEQPGTATIYSNGLNSGVSRSKICLFSVDEIHDYYLQTWECLSKSKTLKSAERILSVFVIEI